MGLHIRNSSQNSRIPVSRTMTTCLSREEIASLRVKRHGIRFHLTEGRAWITYDNQDVIVEAGESVAIPSSRQPVIISSANKYKTICYQIA